VLETPILALKNDSKYHERRKYEEIIWWKSEIFTLHKVLIQHVRKSTDAKCIESVANILLSVHIPVLLYYRLLYAATHFFSHFSVKKLLFQHLRFYRISRHCLHRSKRYY